MSRRVRWLTEVLSASAHCPLSATLRGGAKPSASEQKERGIKSRGGGMHRGDKTKGGIEVVASDGDVVQLARAAGYYRDTTQGAEREAPR